MKKISIYNNYFILFYLIFLSPLIFAEKELRIVSVEWIPYTSETLDQYGYIAEITREAFQATGYKVKFEFYPWVRCLLMLKNGDADVITTIYYTQERSEYVFYSDSIDTATVALLKLKDSSIPSKFSKLQDLKQYSFGVVRDYAHNPEFDNATYLKKDYATTDMQNIQKFLTNRVDIMATISILNTMYLINIFFPEYLNSIQIMEPFLNKQKIYNGFSKADNKSIEYRDAFNRGLKIIKKNGTFSKILEKHNIKKLRKMIPE